MTTINIQNASQVIVEGTRTRRNCKAVYCITTGEMFASVSDAAEANGVYQSNLSWHLAGKAKTCNGKKFCFVNEINEHLNEIVQRNKMIAHKVSKYDALCEAEERVTKHKERCEELRNALEAEMALFADAEQELNELREELK